jgi:hypothetical protein
MERLIIAITEDTNMTTDISRIIKRPAKLHSPGFNDLFLFGFPYQYLRHTDPIDRPA